MVIVRGRLEAANGEDVTPASFQIVGMGEMLPPMGRPRHGAMDSGLEPQFWMEVPSPFPGSLAAMGELK